MCYCIGFWIMFSYVLNNVVNIVVGISIGWIVIIDFSFNFESCFIFDIDFYCFWSWRKLGVGDIGGIVKMYDC